MLLWRIFGASAAVIAAMPATAVEVAGAASDSGTAPVAMPDTIVTAEHRIDVVQQLPMAITAASADTLLARNLTTPLAAAGIVPNMFASNAIGLGSVNLYTLRGLGQTAVGAGFSPSVGTFIDDVYLAPEAGNNFLFFDIERAEVLRGSQGALYGRNTSGGAINIVLARPSDTIGGYGEFSYGAFNRKTARGAINLPLSPVVQLKLSGYFQDDHGYVRNTTTSERLNDSDAAGVRGAVQFKLTEALRWNLAATYMRNDGENLPNSLCDPNDPANCSGRFAATARRANPAFSATNPAAPLGSRLDTQMYTSNIEWAGEDFSLVAITGFVDSRARSTIDLWDGRAMPSIAVPFPQPTGVIGGLDTATNISTSDQFSQELRLTGSLLDGAIDYIAGLLYFDTNTTSDLGYAVVRNGVTDKAGYVQTDFNATDRIKLTAAVRYTDEETRFSIADASQTCGLACLSDANLVTGALPTGRKTRQWTPRFAASYRAGKGVLVYASAARGFRSGGWDARGQQVATILPFDPETAWTYEAGVKADAFGGRLRANLAAYWLEAKDVQAPLLVGGVPVLQNIAGYRNRGVELEVAAVPITGLNLRASLGYQKGRYAVGDGLTPNGVGATSVLAQQLACRAQLAAGQVPLGSGVTNAADCAIGIIDAHGNIAAPARSPDFTLAVGGGYDWRIPAAGIILTPSVDAVYRTAYEAGVANATVYSGSITAGIGAPGGVVYPANPFGGDIIAGSRNPAVWQVSAALTLRTDDNNWTLALVCENCLDTAYVQSVAGTVRYYNPPRIWQIRARRAF